MMKHSQPPITVASSRPVVIYNAKLFEKELFDRRTKEAKHKSTIEAFVVNDPPKKGNKVLYSQTIDCDYVVQPRAMMSRGSMCVTELYGKNMRIKVVQTLIEKKKQNDKLKQMKNAMYPRKMTLANIAPTKFSPLASAGNNPKFDKMRTQILAQPSHSQFQKASTSKLQPFNSQKTQSLNRFKMTKEDEKEFQDIINDARKFLGKDLLRNPQLDKQAPLTLEKKNLKEWIKQKRASYSNQQSRPRHKKQKLLRQMTAESIDLPSDSHSENEEASVRELQTLDPGKIHKILSSLPKSIMHSNNELMETKFTDRRHSKMVKFNIQQTDSKRNSQEYSFSSDKDINQAVDIFKEKKNHNRQKIIKLLNFQSPQSSATVNSLDTSRQFHSQTLSNFHTRERDQPYSVKKKNLRSIKTEAIHKELVYFKKAGGLCIVDSVVPKKQKEGVGIVKQKVGIDTANQFMRIMAKLQTRKKMKLSKEAEKELELSRGVKRCEQ